MPNFSWDPLDFLEALEVVPVEEEYGISYDYIVERGPLTLGLTIWPLVGDVTLALSCAGVSEPVVRLDLLNCPGARVVQGKESRYIEFAAAKVFGGRYDHADAPSHGFRLHLRPFLQVTTFSNSP